mmetsp:Transcript_48804/g.62627  ORF Transcript_48804/g.62627 Transcript_48804/m.62627 type:complete len:379 (+) Transcript_48804:54-1190(+)
MSCVYEVMSDCSRSSAQSLITAQKSRDLFKSMLRDRHGQTTKPPEKPKSNIKRNKKKLKEQPLKTNPLDELLQSKSKDINEAKKHIRGYTSAPYPGIGVGVLCRSSNLPPEFFCRDYESDKIKNDNNYNNNNNNNINKSDTIEKNTILQNQNQNHNHTQNRPQKINEDSPLPIIESTNEIFESLSIHDTWKSSERDRNDFLNGSEGPPNFVQVSVPRTATSSYDQPSINTLDSDTTDSYYPTIPSHRTIPLPFPTINHKKEEDMHSTCSPITSSSHRMKYHRDPTCSSGGLSLATPLFQPERTTRYRVERQKKPDHPRRQSLRLQSSAPSTVRIAVDLKTEKFLKNAKNTSGSYHQQQHDLDIEPSSAPLFELCTISK